MQKYRITVNTDNGWQDLNLSPDEIITMTFSANEIGQPETKSAFISNTFKLPKTPYNNRFLGFPDEIRSGYMWPWSTIPCRLYVDGLEITQGTANMVVRQSSKETIDTYIIGGIYDFMDLIKERSLRDINKYGAERIPSITWNIGGIRDSYLPGYIDNQSPVAIMDWSVETEPEAIAEATPEALGRIDIRTLRPCVRFRRLIECIVKNAGYTLETDVWDEPEFVNMAMLCTSAVPIKGDPDDTFWQGSFIQSGPKSTYGYYNFTDFGVTDGPFFRDSTRLRFQGFERPGTYTFQFNATTQTPKGGSLKLQVLHNGVWTEIHKGTSFEKRTFSLYGKPGDDMLVEMYVYPGREFSSGQWFDVPITIDSFEFACRQFELDENNGVPLNEIWDIPASLPDISQLEAFKYFLCMFGLVLQIDNRRKIVKCYTMQYVYNNRAERGRDWSGKQDSRREDIRFSVGDTYGRENTVKHKQFDYTDENGREQSIVSEGKFYVGGFNGPARAKDDLIIQSTLPVRKDVFEFAGTAMEDVRHLGFAPDESTDIPDPAPDKDNPGKTIKGTGIGGMAKFPVLQNGQTSGEIPVCMVYLHDWLPGDPAPGDPEPGNVVKLYDGTTEVAIDRAVYASFNEIHAQRLVNKYYDVLVNRMLRKTFVLTANFLLYVNDVYDFDHSRPVYLAKYGHWFYVNKVVKYVPGRLTECELIKIGV